MLPPSQFQIEKPPCIRAAMMEYAVSEINSDFGKKINEILDEFTREAKVDRPTAFIMAKKQVDKQTKPYIEAAQKSWNRFALHFTTRKNLNEKDKLMVQPLFMKN